MEEKEKTFPRTAHASEDEEMEVRRAHEGTSRAMRCGGWAGPEGRRARRVVGRKGGGVGLGDASASGTALLAGQEGVPVCGPGAHVAVVTLSVIPPARYVQPASWSSPRKGYHMSWRLCVCAWAFVPNGDRRPDSGVQFAGPRRGEAR
jgi:hypothetical protein